MGPGCTNLRIVWSYITSVCSAEGKGQEVGTGQEAASKRRQGRSDNPVPKQYTFLLARDSLTSPQSWDGGGPCVDLPTPTHAGPGETLPRAEEASTSVWVMRELPSVPALPLATCMSFLWLL